VRAFPPKGIGSVQPGGLDPDQNVVFSLKFRILHLLAGDPEMELDVPVAVVAGSGWTFVRRIELLNYLTSIFS